MATSNRDVEGRSEDWRVCFSSAVSLSIEGCSWPDCERIRVSEGMEVYEEKKRYLCEFLCFGNGSIDLVGVVLVGLDDGAIARHDGCGALRLSRWCRLGFAQMILVAAFGFRSSLKSRDGGQRVRVGCFSTTFTFSKATSEDAASELGV